MLLLNKLKLLLISGSALNAYAQNVSIQDSCFSTIEWEPCPDAANVECASYQVPLDYAQPEVGNATLAVARVRATIQPRLGTLFVNPGGPGGSGVSLVQGVVNLVNQSVAFTNGQYDLVSWDPRGVNRSDPKISCGFTSLDDLNEFFTGTIFASDGGIEARGNFTDQDDLDRFFAAVNETDAKLVQFGQRCFEENGAFLKYMGTTAVVRDMVSLADCLEGPEDPVNYYGISYGTVIGAYFVNMFPQRVGRVIVDGVVDSVIWATEPSFNFFGSLFSSDSVLMGFAETCAEAGPQNCAFAQNDSTAVSIFQDVTQLIDTAYDLHKAGVSNVTAFDVRDTVYGLLASPTAWDSELAPGLASLSAAFANETAGNTSTTSDISPRSKLRSHRTRQNANASSSDVDPQVQAQLTGILVTCLDSIDQNNVTTMQVFDELVRVTHEVSPLFGEVLCHGLEFQCHRFPVRAVERFTGPFNQTLANPIIVIGNKADPRTPLANAQKLAAALGSSAHLLEQDGFGHTSLAENSDCSQGVIRAYLVNGTLPSEGQVCPTDQGLFPPNNTLITSIQSLNS